MKKKVIRCSIIGLAILLIPVIVFMCSRPYPLKYFFYSGDRITGTFTMSVAGIKYEPVDEMLEYANQGTQRLNTNGAAFSIKGGNYGSYKISFVLDNKELHKLTGDEYFEVYTSNPALTFQYINTNWWHVTEMTLSAEMVLLNNEWTVNTKVVYTEPLENGSISENKVENSFSYDEIMSGDGLVYFGV